MTKIQNIKHKFRISIFEFRISTQKGVSLYLALMVMATLLAIALGLNSIFLGQTRTMRAMGHSVLAFYAADAGIEAILMQRDNPPLGAGSVITLSNDAKYQVFVYKGPATEGGPEEKCTATGLYYCITSVGTYKETKRAIAITY
ncbi:MAG: hypothetical protein A2896_01210 [Candidatus Nealsonbacteria bacterium RIFCSPLOWO2_01_FULL_43_32]|uniref:Type 4 fimbrial biogenesis protein PilX N-terminal domain-containing protein n=1 Tax=Candidatus Nealsonbacteria bacterium RIFCSPLOWO2_01_FULL_43_32 TaxID=1801672 RepID=A0A1G2EF36_9BACT|nr:MAG: hypothetical protein A2896_01210 [Candidatus Nealsonbacteria bacterium RIFCSPLOWO2_01_FULL_43_32]